MRIKICPHCQAENPEIAVFCKKCGALFCGEPNYKDPQKEKQRYINLIAVAVCAVMLLVAFIIFKSGSPTQKADSTTASQAGTTLSTTVTTTSATTLPVTESTTAETTSDAVTLPTRAETTTAKPTTTAPSKDNIQEICDSYNTIIENLKGRSWDLNVHKTVEVTAEITDFSLPAPTETINALISRVLPKTDESYDFSNSVATSDSSIALSDYIPPSSASSANVDADDVKQAKMDSNGNITLVFKSDKSSYADGETAVPPHVSTATDPLDFSNFALGSIAVSKAQITYPETVITATVDSDGDLVKLVIEQPSELVCTGGVGSLTADISLKIGTVSTYEITY